MPTDEELEHLKKQTSNPGACMKCQEEVERLRYREKNHLSTIEHQAFLINRDIGLSAENERLREQNALIRQLVSRPDALARIEAALDWLQPWADKMPINPASKAIVEAVKALRGGSDADNPPEPWTCKACGFKTSENPCGNCGAKRGTVFKRHPERIFGGGSDAD